jgi:hypothetical protein
LQHILKEEHVFQRNKWKWVVKILLYKLSWYCLNVCVPEGGNGPEHSLILGMGTTLKTFLAGLCHEPPCILEQDTGNRRLPPVPLKWGLPIQRLHAQLRNREGEGLGNKKKAPGRLGAGEYHFSGPPSHLGSLLLCFCLRSFFVFVFFAIYLLCYLCALWWHPYSQKPLHSRSDWLCFSTSGFNKPYFALRLYRLLCFISPPFYSLLGRGKGPSSEPSDSINRLKINPQGGGISRCDHWWVGQSPRERDLYPYQRLQRDGSPLSTIKSQQKGTIQWTRKRLRKIPNPPLP